MKILITGGTGSLGSALVEKWYEHHQLTILSKDTHRSGASQKRYPYIKHILADITDEKAVYKACLGQEVLIHAAATKQVDIGEYHPEEFIRVNELGTMVVADAWLRTKGRSHPDDKRYIPRQFRKALFISSDKAVMPLNSYGRCKGQGEAIFRKNGYSVVRYGNVVSSAGSFLHVWENCVANNHPVTVRKPVPTRFYLSMAGAINIIEDALNLVERGINGIFIPHNLKAFSLLDVAKALKVPLLFEPLKPGEKQHEYLLAHGEGATKVSEILSQVTLGVWNDQYMDYCSEAAPRMTAKEFLEAVGWKS